MISGHTLLLGFAASSALAWAIALASYFAFRQWVRACRRVRIAVARKQRVQLEAPLTDWLGWARQLSDDQLSRGRVVYHDRGVSVAVLAPRPKQLEVESRSRRLRVYLQRIIRRRPRSAEQAPA